MLVLLATSAHAGPVLELDVGADVPLAAPAQVDPGAGLALVAGYRWSFSMLHLRPEVVARLNTSAEVGAVGAGAAVTFGPSVLAIGPYGHVCAAVGGEGGTAFDAGGLVEITALPVFFFGARVGWQQDRDAAGGPDDWFAAALALGVHL